MRFSFLGSTVPANSATVARGIELLNQGKMLLQQALEENAALKARIEALESKLRASERLHSANSAQGTAGVAETP